jgi:hypothetical protein
MMMTGRQCPLTSSSRQQHVIDSLDVLVRIGPGGAAATGLDRIKPGADGDMTELRLIANLRPSSARARETGCGGCTCKKLTPVMV